jgi:hypothetical protein
MQCIPRPPPCRAPPPPPARLLHASLGPPSWCPLSPRWPSLVSPRRQTPPRMTATHLRRAPVAALQSLFNCLCPELCDAIHYPSLHFSGHPRFYPRRILALLFGFECRRPSAPVGSLLPTPWVCFGWFRGTRAGDRS